MKSTGVYWLPEIPASWEMRGAWSLFSESEEIAEEVAPVLTPSKEFGVVTRDQYIELSGARPQQNFATTHLMRAVRPGQFIITMGSFESGLEYSKISGKITPHYRVLDPAPECDHGYFRWLFKSAPFTDGLSGLATEIRKGQEINYTKFSRLKLPLPPLNQQRGIAGYLDREIAEMNAMDADLDKLIAMLVRRRAAVEDLAIEGPQPVVSLLMTTSAINTGPFGTQVKQADYVADGVPLINPSHIRAGALSPDSRVTVDGQKAAELSRHLMQPGDVVVARRGEMGRCAVVRESDTPVLCGTGSLRVIPGPDMDPEFAALVIRSSDSRNQMTAYSVGATMDNLNEELLGRVRIPLPPLEEQRRIVSALATASARIDAMIGDAERLKALLAERRSTLITEVVTGRKEVPAA